MNYQVTASIVTYHNDISQLQKAIDSVLNTKKHITLYIVDNSSNRDIEKYLNDTGIEYIYTGKNIGFGAAHNIALQKAEQVSKYHIICNPDVYFDSSVIDGLCEFMDNNKKAGCVMPKVLYPDGSLQYLCKLLPTPFDMLIRLVAPLKKIFRKRSSRFEMRFTGYNKTIEVPYVSGCFMFIRMSVLKKTGLFDENIFMYGEDLDLSRRIYTASGVYFWPEVTIYHEHQKESFKSLKMLFAHLKGMFYYFGKWGWLFDKERKRINKRITGLYE